MAQEQFIGPDGTIYEAVPGGGYRIVGGGQSAQPVTLGTPDPRNALAQMKDAADLAKMARDAAREPQERAKLTAETQRAQAEAQRATRELDGPRLTAKERNDIIGQYNDVDRLQAGINELVQLYNQGPGRTSGLSGAIQDNLPSTRNQRFTDAGLRLRGFVKSALGLTGGELNTATEAAAQIGPYLPQASDRDAVILDKIRTLQSLVDNARTGAVAKLGGVPDGRGGIAPIRPNENPLELAKGNTRTERDERVSALIDAGIRRGDTAEKISADIAPFGARPLSDAAVKRSQAYLRANPGYKGSLGLATREVPNSAFSQAAASPGGTFVSSVGDAVTAGTLDNLSSDPATFRQKQALSAAENPKSAMAGTIAGSAIAAGAAELGLGAVGLRNAALAGDALYSAAYGAGSADDGSRLVGAGLGGTLGVIGGGAGRVAGASVGAAARGVTDPIVRRVAARGVPLTVGQALGRSGPIGRAVKGIEDRLTDAPVIGSILNQRRLEGYRAFNLANGREAAEGFAPITQVGERGAEQLDQAVDAAYAPLDRYSAQIDPQLGMDLAAARARGQAIPGRGADYDFVVNQNVVPNFDPATGTMTGRNFQESIRSLRREGATQGPAAMHQGAFSGALGDTEAALSGMFQRQAPEAIPVLEQANRIFQRQAVIDSAVRAARSVRSDGDAIYTPAQLGAAAIQNGTKYGGANQATTTARPFFQEVADAQEVLPSTVPNSGTAGRLAVTGGLLAGGGAVGGGAGYAGDNTGGGVGTGLSVGATLALLQTQAAQRALVASVLNRPDGLVRVGNSYIARSLLPRTIGAVGAGGGAIAAGGLPPMLVGP